MANLAGTNVGATIRPFTSEDTFAVAHQDEIKGGLHTVSTITSPAFNNELPEARRQVGMWIYALDDGKTYIMDANLSSVTEKVFGDTITNDTIGALIDDATDQEATAPADTDSIILGKGSSFNKWTWADFVTVLKTIFESVFLSTNTLTSSYTIVPDLSFRINRMNLVESGTTSATVTAFSNLPTNSCSRTIQIKNSRSNSTALSVTIATSIADATVVNMNNTNLSVGYLKELELNLLFTKEGSNMLVSIISIISI
ncbi:MAG: hypothetical protein WCG93_12905 [Paludibacter sp.]